MKLATHSVNHPRPFLKWVGGKTQLLSQLLLAVAEAGPFRAYREPFLGGGALFFALSQRLQIKKAILSDINMNLIDAYVGVRERISDVVHLLGEHKTKHCHEHYYSVRAHVPDDLAGRAARIIYLNKTCFNGLYRENSRGAFNVPIGRYSNPNICDAANLFACSAALQTATIKCQTFEKTLFQAKRGDLVYFDPPYHPLSSTSSFTAYAKDAFPERKQFELANVFAALDEKGIKVILSNSDTPLIRQLFKRFRVQNVLATRCVNSRPDRRGRITELIIRNF